MSFFTERKRRSISFSQEVHSFSTEQRNPITIVPQRNHHIERHKTSLEIKVIWRELNKASNRFGIISVYRRS